MPRAVSLEGCCSDESHVIQTALAGDAFAATFMKLMLIGPLGALHLRQAAAVPAAVVDDLVLQRWGGAER
eukprot:4297734-Pyramimonas_sp.AAC.1